MTIEYQKIFNASSTKCILQKKVLITPNAYGERLQKTYKGTTAKYTAATLS